MLLDAFDSNWIAPLGPDVDAFEAEFAERVGAGHAVALSSGTAALHLALLLVGVGPGDEVLVPSFTFVATANAVCYLGATPVFVDCVPGHLDHRPRPGGRRARAPGPPGPPPPGPGHRRPLRPVRRLRPVDGHVRRVRHPDRGGRGRGPGSHLPRPACRLASAMPGCSRSTATRSSPPAAAGMLVTESAEVAERARYLATQARDPFPHYEHSDDRVQLPTEQSARRTRPGAAARGSTVASPGATASTTATGRRSARFPASPSCRSPTTASPTTG